MRSRRVAASAALLVSIGSSIAFPPASAYADAAITMYVSNTNSAISTCSDTAATAGALATPFCTVQAAVNAVSAGQTIVIERGVYAPFSISTSGTATAPITIKGTTAQGWTSGAEIYAGTVPGPAITVSGASYVNLVGLMPIGTTSSAVEVSGSNHVTVDGMLTGEGSGAASPVIHLT